MQSWIDTVFSSGSFGPVMLAASFAVGILTSATSGCTFATIGAVAGYAGMQGNRDRRQALLTVLGFIVGVTVILAVLGAVIGAAGISAKTVSGKYGKLFAGFVLILTGLYAFRLLSVNITVFDRFRRKRLPGLWGAVLFGLALGAGSLTCAVACHSPVFGVVLGMAAVQNQVVRSVALTMMFGAGFSLPLVAVLGGVNLGTSLVRNHAVQTVIRYTAGAVLLATGFYFLYSAGR